MKYFNQFHATLNSIDQGILKKPQFNPATWMMELAANKGTRDPWEN